MTAKRGYRGPSIFIALEATNFHGTSDPSGLPGLAVTLGHRAGRGPLGANNTSLGDTADASGIALNGKG